MKAGLLEKLKARAAGRKLSDLTIGPVLTWTTDAILAHAKRLLEIPGAKLLWGGRPLEGHTIPACYGAVEPTAVAVPLGALRDAAHFEAATTEVFGPFQVVVEYSGEPAGCVWVTPGVHPGGCWEQEVPCLQLRRLHPPGSPSQPPRFRCRPAICARADSELPLVLDALERMSHHLTAAVVSNDALFLQVGPPQASLQG